MREGPKEPDSSGLVNRGDQKRRSHFIGLHETFLASQEKAIPPGNRDSAELAGSRLVAFLDVRRGDDRLPAGQRREQICLLRRASHGHKRLPR